MSRRRVVVTGMGMLSPIGNSVETSWSAATAGTSGVGVNPYFDTEDYGVKICAAACRQLCHRLMRTRCSLCPVPRFYQREICCQPVEQECFQLEQLRHRISLHPVAGHWNRDRFGWIPDLSYGPLFQSSNFFNYFEWES